MPEALALFTVFVVAIVAWLGALVQIANPANFDVSQEMARLQLHHRWLLQRLEVARRENWDRDMIASIEDELDATVQQLTSVSRNHG